MAKLRPERRREIYIRIDRRKVITKYPRRPSLCLTTFRGFIKTATSTQINNLIHLIATSPPRHQSSDFLVALTYPLLPWRVKEWRRTYTRFFPEIIDPLTKRMERGFRLGDLPPEIRVIILGFADLEWKTRKRHPFAMVARTMPPLIEALRGWWKRDVYFEALKIFYERAVYVYESNSPYKLHVSYDVQSSIRKARYKISRSKLVPQNQCKNRQTSLPTLARPPLARRIAHLPQPPRLRRPP